MSGLQRFSGAVFLLLAGFSSTPASANAFTDLFGSGENKDAKASTSPQPACLLQPGNSAAPGQRWVYHLDGHRKCWFQTVVASDVARRQSHHHRAAKKIDSSEVQVRKKTALDAKAELMPAEPPPSSTATARAAFVQAPSAQDSTERALVPANDSLPAPAHAIPPSVDVEALLTASMADQDKINSPAKDNAATLDSGLEEWGLMVGPSGMVLIGLGLVLLIGPLLTRGLFKTKAAVVRRASAPQPPSTRHASDLAKAPETRSAPARAPQFLIRSRS